MGQQCISNSIYYIEKLSNFCFPQNEEHNSQILINQKNEKEISKSSNLDTIEKENENLNYKIYRLIDNIRINPENYKKDYNENGNIKETFEEYVNSNQRPNKRLTFLEEESKEISNYLQDKKNNDKSSDEKKEDIYNLLKITNNDDVKYIQSMGVNNDFNSCVWEFFESCDDDLINILSNDYEFIVVSDLPIENTNKIYINVILFNK